MESSQLQCMIECDPVLYGSIIGVYPADRLPLKLPSTPFGFIANTDPHNAHGQHWCAFYCDTPGYVDFFDSYGREPSRNSEHFQSWLNKKAKTIRINRIQLQSETSSVCGLYCVLFLRERLLGHSYQDFINKFDSMALNSNDEYIASTMLNAYPICFAKYENNNQTCSSLVCIPDLNT